MAGKISFHFRSYKIVHTRSDCGRFLSTLIFSSVFGKRSISLFVVFENALINNFRFLVRSGNVLISPKCKAVRTICRRLEIEKASIASTFAKLRVTLMNSDPRCASFQFYSRNFSSSASSMLGVNQTNRKCFICYCAKSSLILIPFHAWSDSQQNTARHVN